jgi:hypothetical protein
MHQAQSPTTQAYHIQWLSDNGNVKIQHTVSVTFKIGAYEDTVECDVVPMMVYHVLLGRPWQFDKKAIHNGHSNIDGLPWVACPWTFSNSSKSLQHPKKIYKFWNVKLINKVA